MSEYRRNHYVPEWFQNRFIPESASERKFFYLDLNPDMVESNGHRHTRKGLLRWGPDSCFCQDDLYTTKFGAIESTEIEQKFFGSIDEAGAKAVRYFAEFKHPSVETDAFHDFLVFLSTQKIRTPKGLNAFAQFVGEKVRNRLLFRMQEFRNMHCALWTECIWSLVSAANSDIKFLLSDHPVTVYNPRCFPASNWCRGDGDPPIWLNGTHTIFPLQMDKALILTNLSWVRNPYGNAMRARPNPHLFRGAMFNFTSIQTGRELDDDEVDKINLIIKTRARRYVAAFEKDWLYPESRVEAQSWDKLTYPYLLMPDPRAVNFSTEIIIGYKGGHSDAFDEYGHKPWQKGFTDKRRERQEWETFHAFESEYARLFGSRRRGQAFSFMRLDEEEDSPEYHASLLAAESRYRKGNRRRRR